MKSKRLGVFSAGLALFSMFFGAGDLIWPLILGGDVGAYNFYALCGLLITGVGLPLLGLMAMVLFHGNYKAFFNQIGRGPAVILLFIVQAILGPFGSTPRLFTLAYASLKPYLPALFNLPVFCLFAIAFVFFCAVKKHRVVDLLGLILCPILLCFLVLVISVGVYQAPTTVAFASNYTASRAFFYGLSVGYNTLDIIASFIFAPLVLFYFCSSKEEDDTIQMRREAAKKMVKASLISAFLLASMFCGLSYLASFYKPLLPIHAPEERIAVISSYLLGSRGAIFSCVIVVLSCLTTAIPISIISSEYIQERFLGGRSHPISAMLIGLVLSAIIANLGFMGIAQMLSPFLQIICPGIIILCVFSILHKLYEMRIRRVPVFVAFFLALISYLIKI